MSTIVYTKEFQNAFDAIEQGRNVCILGGGGVGKTVWIREFFNKCTLENKFVAVAAPTGIAACNIGEYAYTVHSLFGIPSYLQSEQELTRINPKVYTILSKLDIIVIDEISMVNPLVFDNISKIAQHARHSTKPFGGIQIVIVGDPFQLPPVITHGDRKLIIDICQYKSCFFFSAEHFALLDFVFIKLTTVFRQNNKDFVDALNRLRFYDVDQDVVDYFNQRVGSYDEQSLILAATNKVVNKHNLLSIDRIKTPLRFYSAKVQGKFDEKECPTDFELVLKVGARVMIVANIEEAVNGDMGTIYSMSNETITVDLDKGYLIDVEPYTWIKYGYSINSINSTWETAISGFCTQFPIRLATAATVHKSQGLTLEKVHIDLESPFFVAGQAYVAFSRARNIQGLSLSRPVTVSELNRWQPRIDRNGKANDTKILIDWYNSL